MRAVQFQDESRDIASEYKGGLARYTTAQITPPAPPPPIAQEDTFDFSIGDAMIGSTVSQATLPPIQPHLPPSYPEPTPPEAVQDGHHSHSHTSDAGKYAAHEMSSSHTAYGSQDVAAIRPDEGPHCLTSPEEVLYLQVFVEDVGLWMDTYDPMKHVRR